MSQPLSPILRNNKLVYSDQNTGVESLIALPTANDTLSIYDTLVSTELTTSAIYLNGLQGKLEYSSANNTLKLDNVEVALKPFVDNSIPNTYIKFIANELISAGNTVSLRANDGKIEGIVPGNANNFIGIAKDTIAAGQEGTVYMIGDVADNQIGLTTNQLYYLEANGSLTTTETSYGLVGRAISNTSIKLLEPIVNDYNNLINKPATVTSEQLQIVADDAFVNSIIFG